jgi:hypothetical protein
VDHLVALQHEHEDPRRHSPSSLVLPREPGDASEPREEPSAPPEPRRKTPDREEGSLITTDAPTDTDAVTLKRSLGLRSVVLFGLAYLAPMIVLATFGVLAQKTHGTVPTGYLLALVALLFTAMSYGKMSARFPVAAPGRSQLLTSTASISRPSAARGNGSPDRHRRSRVRSIRPWFTASYKAP